MLENITCIKYISISPVPLKPPKIFIFYDFFPPKIMIISHPEKSAVHIRDDVYL